MPILVSDCPRCATSKITFDVLGESDLRGENFPSNVREDAKVYEIFCRCRSCSMSTTFVVAAPPPGRTGVSWVNPLGIECSIDRPYQVVNFVSIADLKARDAPEHVPKPIRQAFMEGSRSYAIGCWNAAGCMFRASIDLATRSVLDGIIAKDERDVRWLGRRLSWMFKNGHLPADLKELSACIKEDGDDAAHSATLNEADASDLQDFSCVLLERIFTDVEKVNPIVA